MSAAFWITLAVCAIATAVAVAACVAGGRADEAAAELERRRRDGETARVARRHEWPTDEPDEHAVNLGAF